VQPQLRVPERSTEMVETSPTLLKVTSVVKTRPPLRFDSLFSATKKKCVISKYSRVQTKLQIKTVPSAVFVAKLKIQSSS